MKAQQRISGVRFKHCGIFGFVGKEPIFDLHGIRAQPLTSSGPVQLPDQKLVCPEGCDLFRRGHHLLHVDAHPSIYRGGGEPPRDRARTARFEWPRHRPQLVQRVAEYPITPHAFFVLQEILRSQTRQPPRRAYFLHNRIMVGR